MAIAQARDWYAVFDKQGTEVKTPVAFWHCDNSAVMHAIVYHPGQKELVEASLLNGFLRLEYDPLVDATRSVTKEQILAWIAGHSRMSEKDVRASFNAEVVKICVGMLAQMEFQGITDKDSL